MRTDCGGASLILLTVSVATIVSLAIVFVNSSVQLLAPAQTHFKTFGTRNAVAAETGF